jgi:hypothetical protein
MKNFNAFAEALLVTTAQPESDSVGPVSPDTCPCQAKDRLTQTVEDTLGTLGSPVQPDDEVGEYGEIDGEAMEPLDGDGVELECLGDEGLIVKFAGTAILLPKNVVEKIKTFEPSEGEEGESEEHEEGEETEQNEGGEEEDEQEDEEGDEKKSSGSKAFDINENVHIKKTSQIKRIVSRK